MQDDKITRGEIVRDGDRFYWIPQNVDSDEVEIEESEEVVVFEGAAAEKRASIWKRLNDQLVPIEYQKELETAKIGFPFPKRKEEPSIPLQVGIAGHTTIAAYLFAHGHRLGYIADELDFTIPKTEQLLDDFVEN